MIGGPNLEKIILQRFSSRSESSEQHVGFPAFRGPYTRKMSPAFGFEDQKGLIVKSQCGAGRNRDFTFKGHTQNLMHTRTQSKSSHLIGAWADLPIGLREFPGGWGWSAVTLGTETLAGTIFGNFQLNES